MRKATDQRDAQTISLLWTSLLLFHGGDVPWWWFDQFWCHEVGCGVRWSNQGTTPVLLCTAKYYSSTTLYCKVLFQYYSVLHSTTPVLLCTTKYYSSTTLYYKVLLQYYSVLHSTTTCYSSSTLYYKAAFMIDVRRIWNVIYNARSNRSHPPTSRNTAPATQNDCDDWSASHMKLWAEQQESQSIFTKYCTCHADPRHICLTVSHQPHQILRLPRNL